MADNCGYNYQECLDASRMYAIKGDVIQMANWLNAASQTAQLSHKDSQSIFDVYWNNGLSSELSGLDFQRLDLFTKRAQRFLSCLDAIKDWRGELCNQRTREFLESSRV